VIGVVEEQVGGVQLLYNKEGRAREKEENKCILLALNTLLNVHIRLIKQGVLSFHEPSWTVLEETLAKEMAIKQRNV
jgi:hypothetical protein